MKVCPAAVSSSLVFLYNSMSLIEEIKNHRFIDVPTSGPQKPNTEVIIHLLPFCYLFRN